MNEINEKLDRIKKSCHTGKIVSNVFCIIAIVGCVLSLIAGISIFAMGREFDDMIESGREAGIVSVGDKIGGARMIDINLDDPSSIESDIPALKEAIADHPFSILYGTYIMSVTVILAVVAVMMKLISSVFAMIEKEETPFSDKVRKRVTIVLAITSGILLLTNGAALGVLGALVTWAVYTILDYGKTLQTQSDETL